MDYCLVWVTSAFTIILVIFVVLLFDIDTQTVFMCSTTDRLGGIYQLELVLGQFPAVLSMPCVFYPGNGCGSISAQINLICSICICHTIRIIVPSFAVSSQFPAQ